MSAESQTKMKLLYSGLKTAWLKNGLIIGIRKKMKTRKIGNIWKVWFLDCEGNIQTAEHKSLQLALAMAFLIVLLCSVARRGGVDARFIIQVFATFATIATVGRV